MPKALRINSLLRCEGASVFTEQGEQLGHVAEITRDSNDNQIEYIILKSDDCFGPGYRFFAVPASSHTISITESAKIILNINLDELQFADGISANKCPTLYAKSERKIYELFKYVEPANLDD